VPYVTHTILIEKLAVSSSQNTHVLRVRATYCTIITANCSYLLHYVRSQFETKNDSRLHCVFSTIYDHFMRGLFIIPGRRI